MNLLLKKKQIADVNHICQTFQIFQQSNKHNLSLIQNFGRIKTNNFSFNGIEAFSSLVDKGVIKM